jgi:hypothetical protein
MSLDALRKAEQEMRKAHEALIDYADSKGERDPAKHRALLENIHRAINQYLDQINVLRRDDSMWR